MNTTTFIHNFREAFGQRAELPVAFWYSDTSIGFVDKINGCLFKGMKEVREGAVLSLNAENIGCGGGAFYTGFTEMPDRIPNFVSLKEKYKQSPALVQEFITQLGIARTDKCFLNFARVDKIEDFQEIEGLVFFATPDILSGLTTWAYFDNNTSQAVASLFGSGCSVVISQTILENRRNGKSTFIGLFDPSVRPYFEPDILSFTIPMSRFKEMYHTMRDSCLFDTHAWKKVKMRINEQD